MSTFFTVISILITFFVLVICQYNNTALNISFLYSDKVFTMPLLIFGLFIFTFGILTGVLLMLGTLLDTSRRYARLKREYEKSSVKQDGSEDRVRLLENKINTLEAALKRATKE